MPRARVATYSGQRASRQARRATMLALNKWIEGVAKQSQREVPKDKLPLAKSMEVTRATADRLNVGISYGTPYALIQHEELSFHHPTPGTKAKYLEDPINDHRPRLGPMIAREAKRAGLA